jgi:hypothetical protein
MKRHILSCAAALWLAGCAAAVADDYATRVLEATFKVFHKDSTATGFLIAPPSELKLPERHVLLATAAHILERSTGETMLLVLRQPVGDGTFKRRDVPIAVRKGRQPLWTKHKQEDAAVLTVQLPTDAVARPLPLEALADEAALRAARLHVCSGLCVLGFPTRFESNAAGFPVARHATVASHPLAPVAAHRTFLADFCTFPGDSGGPVFLADPRRAADGDDAPPLIVGMVTGHFRHDEKLDMLFEERTIHHPLGLGIVLHSQYVRETIAQLQPPAAEKAEQKAGAP